MKKILFSAIAFIAIATTLHAQDETTATTGFAKGDVFITGSVGFSSRKQGDEKTTQFNISPKAAYFITNNIAIGVSLGYIDVKNPFYDSNANRYTEKTQTFQAGIFGRYYVNPANAFSIFGHLGINYDGIKNKLPGNTATTNNGYSANLSPGISYFVSPHFALEATIGAIEYNTTKTDYPGAQSTNSFGIGVDLTNIAFGAVYKF